MHFVYVLRSVRDGSVYVGQTQKHPAERQKEHNWGMTPWTKAHRPFQLAFFEAFESKTLAGKRERFLKTGKGRQVLRSKLNDIRAISFRR